MSAAAVIHGELERALGDLKASHAPVIFVAGYVAGLRFALDALRKSEED